MSKLAIKASPNHTPLRRRRNPHDAGLLFCCMDVLQIDHSKLARDEPLLYRELQGVAHSTFQMVLMACVGTNGGCTVQTPQC
jgi:hypothetical protein